MDKVQEAYEKIINERSKGIVADFTSMSTLINTIVGFTNDIDTMIKHENYKDALKGIKVLKTKVLVDLEKEIKKSQ